MAVVFYGSCIEIKGKKSVTPLQPIHSNKKSATKSATKVLHPPKPLYSNKKSVTRLCNRKLHYFGGSGQP